MPDSQPETGALVEYDVREGVAWISVGNPPVNALSQPVRQGLLEAVARAEEDPEVSVLVIHGRGHTFPSGGDIAETDRMPAAPRLSELCARIEACCKPVVAAMHGTALGGGVELALAAHYRVALGSLRLGLPEVRLGLLPSAGATQRLPRFLGAQAALEMMLSGATYGIDRPPAQGLVDRVTEGELPAVTAEFCRWLRDEGKGPHRSSELRQGFADPAAYQAAVQARREETAAHPEPAPREIVAAVEAAMLLPFEAGLAFEADAYETCLGSDASHALRAAFFAERRAAKFGLPRGTALPEIDRVAVLGGGVLAAQIVVTALNAGLGVNWGTRDPGILREGVVAVRDVFRQSIARRLLTEAQVEDRLTLLRVGDSAAMTGDVEMIIHASKGQGDVPAPAGVPRAVAFRGRVDALGLRFQPPAHVSRLLEVIAGPAITPERLAAALALARALGKAAVKVVSTGDSISGRLHMACQRAADALLDLGQSPYDIDAAFRDWGWTRPPFLSRDMAGLGAAPGGARPAGSHDWSALLAASGRTGRASGHGFYDWSDGPAGAREDAALTALLDGTRGAAKRLSPAQLRLPVLAAMANEGARMLSEGMAARPSDIDLVALLALAMPRWRGGPLHLAGVQGMLATRRVLETLPHPDSAFWTPDPLWGELVKNGKTFAALNG